MRLPLLTIALCTAFASPALAQSVRPIQPGLAAVFEFGDWSTACDNVRRCVSVSVSQGLATRLASSEPGDYAQPILWVRREANSEARPRVFIDLSVWGQRRSAGRLTLHVYYEGATDRTGRSYILNEIETGYYELTPSQTQAFLAESARSTRAATRSANGEMHGLLSTRGLVAALRHTDEAQGRSGTVTAIYGTGPLPASDVPSAPTMPTVTVMRGAGSPADMPTQADRAQEADRVCGVGTRASRQDSVVYALTNGQRLWSIDCGLPQRFWQIEVEPGRFTIAILPRPDLGIRAEQPLLANSSFDPASGTLTAFHKARSHGDCGWQLRWAWTGTEFQMIDALDMPACLGLPVSRWLQTYRAVPE